jgi:hypothetical protein
MVEWFSHITDPAEELPAEFDLIEAIGATPKQYGLTVLMVTSRVKMALCPESVTLLRRSARRASEP